MRKALFLQKIVFKSNSSRLLAIRNVTQIDWLRKISGVDGISYLSFSERFYLNQFLKRKFFVWIHGKIKVVNILRKDGLLFKLNLPTVNDRVWQCLLRFGLEPAHEARFNPRNLGFRNGIPIYDVQRVLYYNLCRKSFGLQKRVLLFNLKYVFRNFSHDFLLKYLIIPRSLRLCIFRLLRIGFIPDFLEEVTNNFYLDSIVANILLDGIEELHPSIRFGFSFILFLKPTHIETIIVNKVFSYLQYLGLNSKFNDFSLINVFEGFDFLGWYFKVYSNGSLTCYPSFSNYQSLLIRVKHILNNSNYGVRVKVSKVSPIIKEWYSYHCFSNLNSRRYSLFFIKARAFKIFKGEAKQDIYSSKIMLDKVFSSYLYDYKIKSTHKLFWFDYFSGTLSSCSLKNYYCIFCGIQISI